MPTAFQDYYAILGVPRTATQKEIKAAFRKLARQHHPDLNRNDAGAERKFKEVNEANEVLSDPEKRRRYDELGPRWREYEAWEKAGKPGASPFAAAAAGADGAGVEYRTVSPDELEAMFGNADPFSDFFHSMFGQSGGRAASGSRSRRAQPRRGDDIQGTAAISLAEAYAGTTRTVEITGENGRSRRLEVSIPPGVADGARVRAAGQGAQGRSGAGSGDLYVVVSIAPDARFTREGDNLRIVVEVPLDVAILGGDLPVPTLRGTSVHLTVPRASQNGAKLRLRGLGMPRLRGEGHGDLIAELAVRLPATPTPEVVALAEAVRAQRLGTPAEG